MKDKIGILTFVSGANFGQRLQNYALQKTIEGLGYECYTIQQTSPYSFGKLFLIGIKRILRQRVNFVQEYRRRVKFNEFNQANIKIWNQKLSFSPSPSESKEIKKHFKAFVAGSDQIWNPFSPDVGSNFFLEFADKNQRVTYAPSFSVDAIPEEMIPLYKKRLNGFSFITVREKKGAEIVKEIIGKDATVVLDPTLLLNLSDWEKIRKAYLHKPKISYALSLFLGKVPRKEIDFISKKYNIYIYNLSTTAPISPSEFLDIVKNASFVLTDSYHASIFSTIYHKPFINFTREGTNIDMNSRFTTLYHNLGVSNRNWSVLKKQGDSIMNINFDEIDNKIVKQKDECVGILSKLINQSVNN